jgi:hypothetical protein
MNVMIPTKGRPDKLAVCLKSIPEWVGVCIVATTPSDIPKDAALNRPYVDIKIDSKMTVPQAFNYMVSVSFGDVVMASDDIEYEPGAFEVLERLLDEHGHDIVIGMKVTNMVCNEDAFQCIGKVFKERHAPLYCEEYRHFYIDTEVGDLARREGKFIYCPDARLKNYHPNSGCRPDATHSEGRSEKLSHDQAVYERRRGMALLLPQEMI